MNSAHLGTAITEVMGVGRGVSQLAPSIGYAGFLFLYSFFLGRGGGGGGGCESNLLHDFISFDGWNIIARVDAWIFPLHFLCMNFFYVSLARILFFLLFFVFWGLAG